MAINLFNPFNLMFKKEIKHIVKSFNIQANNQQKKNTNYKYIKTP